MAEKTVVVTGASSGIGLAAARHLAEHGYTVFGTVRKRAAAEQFGGQAALRPLLMDVTDHDSIRRAAAEVEAHLSATGGRMAGLVNNAGVAVSGPLGYVPLKAVRLQFEVNVIGLLAVTQAFLPLMQQADQAGRIINISSISARVTTPFMGPYSASKFALEAFSDALRVELMPFGIKVIIIQPGPIATPIWNKGADRALAMYRRTPYQPVIKSLLKYFAKQGRTGLPAAVIAQAILSALQTPRPKTRYLITAGKPAILISQLLPDVWRDRLLYKRSHLERVRPE